MSASDFRAVDAGVLPEAGEPVARASEAVGTAGGSLAVASPDLAAIFAAALAERERTGNSFVIERVDGVWTYRMVERESAQ